ncbi:MAG: ectonucleotide pyrophosphatase/phosphodiesterase [Myxococcota bacterium]
MKWFGRALLGVGGVAGIAALAGIGGSGWLPAFDWMAPTRIEREVAARGAAAPRVVLLISIDGLAPRVLERASAPTLRRLAREGSAAALATTVVPSRTLPAHTSMVSGVPPKTHGVTWNRYQPWSRIQVPTLFTVCRERGLRCGLFAGKRKFAHYAEQESGVERYAYGESAGEVLDAALAYLRERAPDFAMIHLAEVDRAGHERGWGSPRQRASIAAIDAQLAAFLAEAASRLARPLSLLVTADHGGHGTTHGSDRSEDVQIPWIAWGDGVPRGAPSGPVHTVDTASTVLTLLGAPVPEDWTGRSWFPREGSPQPP